MKILFAVLVLSCCLHAQDPNCSYGTMTPTGVAAGCQAGPGQTPPFQPGTVVPNPTTYSFNDQCWDDSSGISKLYGSMGSSVTGQGQCLSLGYHPGITWQLCFPQSAPVEIDAFTSGGYNQFYNYAYDYYFVVSGGGIAGGPIKGSCQPTGTGKFDLKQCHAKACLFCGNGGGSPIILDVTGEGFHLTSEENGVKFDILADGNPVQTSWTDPHYHTSLLVHDVPTNGRLTGKNLFGNHTYNGCRNGYCALAEFARVDLTKTSTIDSSNAAFAKLKLWDDVNHDGIAQPNELSSLSSKGVTSLSVVGTSNSYTDVYGNSFRYKGKVNPLGQPSTDHVDRTSYDVFFVFQEPPQPECVY
jgi:hypothetical protein